jgi:hypothetical protein
MDPSRYARLRPSRGIRLDAPISMPSAVTKRPSTVFVCERADQVGLRGLAEQHSQRSQQQCLAGAGLPGDHRELRPGEQLGVLDQTEVADDQLVDHLSSSNFLVTLVANPSS